MKTIFIRLFKTALITTCFVFHIEIHSYLFMPLSKLSHSIMESGVSLIAQQYRIHLQCRRLGFDFWVVKFPWRRKQQLTPLFLPKESLGQRSLVGYSPQGCKELDKAEVPELSHTHSTQSYYLPPHNMSYVSLYQVFFIQGLQQIKHILSTLCTFLNK